MDLMIGYIMQSLMKVKTSYIYRDRLDRVGEDGWNEWEVIANKSVDFDKWWRYEEVWDRKTNTVLEIDDAYLEEYNIPHLIVDENGEVVKNQTNFYTAAKLYY